MTSSPAIRPVRRADHLAVLTGEMIQSGRIGTGCTFDPEQKNQSNVFYEIHVVFTLRPSLMYCLSETMEVLQVGGTLVCGSIFILSMC